MKLPISYEDNEQVIEIDLEDLDRLCVCLSIEQIPESQEEKEALVRETFDKEFNKPDHSNWRRHSRNTVQMSLLTKNSEDPDADDALAVRAFRDLGFHSDEDEIQRFEDAEQFKEDCRWVRDVLKSKPHWASAFIAVRMKGRTVRDYANSIDVDETTVSHWLERAEKKLRKFYENRQT